MSINRFRKGDIVIWSGEKKDYENFLTLDKEYIVYDSLMTNFIDNTTPEIITIIDDTNLLFDYNGKYFLTKIEYRNLKINEILM